MTERRQIMKTYRPDRKGLATLRLLILAFTVLLILAVNYFVPLRKAALIADISLATVSLAVMFIYLPLYFASVSYRVTGEEIIRSSGVFVKFHQSIKLPLVQHSMVITTPLSRFTGMNFLMFFALGGQINLMFLSYDDMMEILRLFSEPGGDI